MPKKVKNFAFISNPLDVRFRTAVEVIPGHIFKKATPRQISLIKEWMSKNNFLRFWNPYELDSKLVMKKGTQTQHTAIPLKPIQFRYFIIEFQGNNAAIHDLGLAGNICPVQLRCDLQFDYLFGKADKNTSPGVTSHIASTYNFFSEMSHSTPLVKRLLMRDLQCLGNVYNRIKFAEKDFPEIFRSIEMFNSVMGVHRSSDFYTLGLFAVIESVIAHEPRENAGDSLNHQISTKLPLVTRLFDREMDCSSFFDECSESTLWKTLYSYRSNIAHGKQTNFTGKQSRLRSRKSVLAFLEIFVPSLLRLALNEPQLIQDLQSC